MKSSLLFSFKSLKNFFASSNLYLNETFFEEVVFHFMFDISTLKRSPCDPFSFKYQIYVGISLGSIPDFFGS